MSIFGKEGFSERVRSWSIRISNISKVLKNRDLRRDNPDMLVRYASKLSSISKPDTLFQNDAVSKYANEYNRHSMPDFKDRIFTQEVKYLNGKKLGFRNEGDYPNNIPSADISLFHRFKPAGEYVNNESFETFIGNSTPLGRIVVGPIKSFATNDYISPVYSAVVDKTDESNGSYRMTYKDRGGVSRRVPISRNLTPGNMEGDAFGGFYGGHVILKGKNGLSIVSGSSNFISNEIRNQSYDGNGLIEMFLPDNGTYNFPLKKTTPITKDDLINWDLQNETGGTFGYIK